MTVTSKKVDWPGFIGRELPVMTLTSVWLFQRLQRHDSAGVMALYGLLFILLTYLNFRLARRL